MDPKEHFRTTHTAYAAPALAAPVSTAATSDALLTRMGDLERALRQVQGQYRQPYQFRDIYYFPKVALPPKF